MISITEIFNYDNHLSDRIEAFFKKYIGCSLLSKCNITKIVDEVTVESDYEYFDNPILRLIGDVKNSRVLKKVVSAKVLLMDKIAMCFHSASPYRMFKEGTFFNDYKKDTFYRFDRLPKANWECLQLETAKNVIDDIQTETTNNHVNALIFDDSLYSRTRGKGTELCARVHDHTIHKSALGFRMMTGGWTNSDVYVPFAQALLSTRDDSKMVGPDDPVDMRTVRGKRRKLAKTKGTEVVYRMVKQAQAAGIPFDYVLFDTWFSNPAQLVALKGIGADVIAMIKKGSTKYAYKNPETGDEQKLNVKEIYSRNKKRRGRSRYLLSVNVTISDKDGKSIPAKLVYARNRSNRKDWVCFVCTDMDADEERILRVYTLRWKCELYFGICKGYLKLRTECHSTSYDAITSHMVIVAIRYMMLAIERFKNMDNRTIEEFFYKIQREVVNEMMDCTITLILDVMLESVRETFNATDEQMNVLVSNFVKNLPMEWRVRFSIPDAA